MPEAGMQWNNILSAARSYYRLRGNLINTSTANNSLFQA